MYLMRFYVALLKTEFAAYCTYVKCADKYTCFVRQGSPCSIYLMKLSWESLLSTQVRLTGSDSDVLNCPIAICVIAETLQQ